MEGRAVHLYERAHTCTTEAQEFGKERCEDDGRAGVPGVPEGGVGGVRVEYAEAVRACLRVS